MDTAHAVTLVQLPICGVQVIILAKLTFWHGMSPNMAAQLQNSLSFDNIEISELHLFCQNRRAGGGGGGGGGGGPPPKEFIGRDK